MAEQKRVSQFTIVNYSAVYMPISMALLPVGVYVQPHYAELGISLFAISGIIFTARLSDVFTDPLIGVLSDRTRSRLGRRKPWILAGTPLLMVSLYMLFVPPPQPSVWYFGSWIVLLYLAFTIVNLPYFAWGAELSNNYAERTKITGRREQFHFAGTVMATALSLVVGALIYFTTVRWDGIAAFVTGFSSEFRQIMAARAGNPGTILRWLALFVVVMLPISVALALRFVPETRQIAIPRRAPGFLTSLKVVRRNGPFMRLIICYTVSVLGASMTGILSFFFVKHVVRAGELYPLYLLLYYLSSVLGLPIWTHLANRMGKHRAFIVAVIWYAFWASFIPFIPAGRFELFLFIMCMKGSSVGALLAIPAAMAADAIDIDSARSGEQRAGLYFSLWGMLQKGAAAVGGALALTAVGILGFDARADPALGNTASGNSATALLALALCYSIIPAAFKFISLPFMWRYPLTEARQQRIRARLERRAAATAAAEGMPG